MAAFYLSKLARFSRLLVISFCIFAGHLPASHAKETKGDKSSLADWQVLGLLDAIHDTDLEVPAQALLKLASGNGIPDELRSSNVVLRTVRDLLNSPISSDVKSGLTLSVLSGESVERNQVTIRKILNQSAVSGVPRHRAGI